MSKQQKQPLRRQETVSKRKERAHGPTLPEWAWFCDLIRNVVENIPDLVTPTVLFRQMVSDSQFSIFTASVLVSTPSCYNIFVMSTLSWFKLLYGRNQHNVVRQLSPIKNKILKNQYPWCLCGHWWTHVVLKSLSCPWCVFPTELKQGNTLFSCFSSHPQTNVLFMLYLVSQIHVPVHFLVILLFKETPMHEYSSAA